MCICWKPLKFHTFTRYFSYFGGPTLCQAWAGIRDEQLFKAWSFLEELLINWERLMFKCRGLWRHRGQWEEERPPTQPGVLWNTSWRELDEKGSRGAGRAVQAEGIAPATTLRQKNMPGAAGNSCSGSEVLNWRGCAKRWDWRGRWQPDHTGPCGS